MTPLTAMPFTLDHLLAAGAVLFAALAFAHAAYFADHVWPVWEREDGDE